MAKKKWTEERIRAFEKDIRELKDFKLVAKKWNYTYHHVRNLVYVLYIDGLRVRRDSE